MTQPILLIDQIYAVEMPAKAEAYKIECMPQADLYELQFFKTSEDPDFFGELDEFRSVDLPAGNWEIICTTKEVTEEQAKGIVGSSEWYFPARHTRYIDYTKPYDSHNRQEWSVGFSGPRDSFRSLFTSKGLDPNKNYIILKKVS